MPHSNITADIAQPRGLHALSAWPRMTIVPRCNSVGSQSMHRRLLLLIVSLVLALTGCLYVDDDAPERPDAAAGPTACLPTPDRNHSCRTICAADIELCAGADWTVCFEECRAGFAFTAWCPGGDSAGR
jgi:hypothetical protein